MTTPKLDALVEKWKQIYWKGVEPVSLVLKQCALEWAKEVQEQYNNEIGEFQNLIKTLVDEKSGTNVDGAGCESGDWRDFTRSEIAQGLNHVIDQRDSALKSMATYGGIEDLLCPEFEGIDDLVECFRLLKEERDSLRTELLKVKADKERLDWLDIDDNVAKLWESQPFDVEFDIRAAIDQAIAAKDVK